jgi:hypothetical protein
MGHSNDQAVLVYLDGSRLSTKTFDLPTDYAVEDRLEAAIAQAGVEAREVCLPR